ncbi:hypothetical protein Y032_0004g1879 [Ancylostoma ceylanicum]|nr:hypothetical protein Y032_0004g1879 [Ancylostoma ceylanicum]
MQSLQSDRPFLWFRWFLLASCLFFIHVILLFTCSEGGGSREHMVLRKSDDNTSSEKRNSSNSQVRKEEQSGSVNNQVDRPLPGGKTEKQSTGSRFNDDLQMALMV